MGGTQGAGASSSSCGDREHDGRCDDGAALNEGCRRHHHRWNGGGGGVGGGGCYWRRSRGDGGVGKCFDGDLRNVVGMSGAGRTWSVDTRHRLQKKAGIEKRGAEKIEALAAALTGIIEEERKAFLIRHQSYFHDSQLTQSPQYYNRPFVPLSSNSDHTI